MTKPEKKEYVKVGLTTDGFFLGYNTAIDDYEKFLPSEEEILRIVIENALKLRINTKENQAFVFICCGKSNKPIEVKGQCPCCNGQNTEVVNLWKYNLAKAIANRLRGK